ncbi:MAG: hypothetical protein R3F56_13350 [Planctomycetota bacterium]
MHSAIRQLSVFLLATWVMAQTPRLLLDINRTPTPPASSDPFALSFVGGRGYFTAWTHALGAEPYRTDFSAVGATLLRDLVPGPESVEPSAYVDMGGSALFIGSTGRLQVWRTDGSTVGTTLVADLGPKYAIRAAGTNLSGVALFVVDDGFRQTLLRSDGTSAGTTVLGSFRSQYYGGLATTTVRNNQGNYLFFSGIDLVCTDGSALGTSVVALNVVPYAMAELGGSAYFVSASGLWRAQHWGSFLVHAHQSIRSGVVAVGGRVLFVANNELWASDGTSVGTAVVRPFRAIGSNLVAAGSHAYFAADDGTSGTELWRTDGTAAATSLVADLTPGPAGSSIDEMVASGSRVLFRVVTAATGSELGFSDGSAAGTRVLDLEPGASGSGPMNLVADPAGSRVLFSASRPATGREPWVTDGTVAGTYLLADLATNNGSTFGSDPWAFTPVGDRLLFFATDPATGHEPWVTDGTAVGTRPLGDLEPGWWPSVFPWTSTLSMGDRVFFTATTNALGAEPWVSDGTPTGTHVFVDLLPGPAGSESGGFRRLTEDRILFAGSDGSDVGLFVTDVIAANPQRLAAVRVAGLVAANGRALFAGFDSQHGSEPWVTDGTLAGTRMVTDLTPGPDGTAFQPVVYAGAVYFIATSGTQVGLWRTDGTAAGTVLAVPLAPQTQLRLWVAHERLYFVGFDPRTGYEPWVSDGSVGGTFMLADVEPGSEGCRINAFAEVDAGVLFETTEHGLWRTDGTPASTRQTFAPGPMQDPGFVAGSRRLWSSTLAGVWASDGTIAGTRVLPGLISWPPRFGLAGPMLVGTISDGVHGGEPWLVERAARAVPVGAGCGTGWRELKLAANDPVLGDVLTFAGRRLVAGSSAAVAIGAPLLRPLALSPSACTLYFDAVAPYMVLPTASFGSSFTTSLLLPSMRSLDGVALMAQAIALPGGTPLGYELSNGVALYLGPR